MSALLASQKQFDLNFEAIVTAHHDQVRNFYKTITELEQA